MQNLKSIFLRYRKNFITIFSIILFLSGIASIYFILKVNVISNDECLWVNKKINDSTVIVFDQVKIGGVAWNAGIRDGDILLEIDGIQTSNTMIAMDEINKHEYGDFADYKVKRNDQIFDTRVYIKKLIMFPQLGFSLLALIWLLVGYIVIMAKPDGLSQQLFYGIGAALMLNQFYLFVQQKINLTGIDSPYSLIILISVFGGTFLPYLILYFFFIFPKPFAFAEKKWVRNLFIILPSITFFMWIMARLLLHRNLIPVNLFVFVSQIVNFIAIGSFYTSAVFLIINYRSLETKEEKKKIIVIVISYILGMAALFYSTTVASIIADNIFNSPEYFMPIILVTIIPIAFGYSIFKYQLLDVSIVVKNAIVYGTATAAIATLYLLSVYGLGQSIGSAVGTEYQNAIAAAAFVVFAIVFQSTKDKFQDVLTKKFYPEQFAHQKMLMKFSKDVVSIVGLENILDAMHDTFVKSLNLDQFAILLRQKENDRFFISRQFGLNNANFILHEKNIFEFVQGRIKINGPISVDRENFSEVFENDSEILIANNIFTVTPMIIKNKIIGLLLFGLKHSGSQFAGKDLDLLSAAANQAAVAIENARLYEAEAQKITLERDLTLAKRIQKGLLPKCIPNLQGLDICGEMIPAMQVGGDYFDLIKIDENKLFIVVGDVSGKGLSASLYMSKLQTMMKLYCKAGRSPKEILIDANKDIYSSVEKGWFITVNLALIDMEKRKIKFCRAGHSQLLAINGSENSLIQPAGIGLGLDDGKIFDSTLEELEIELKPNEIYGFFSDGISEAMNSKGELFGIEKLCKVINLNKEQPASEIMQSVLTSLDNFRNGFEQNDDITLVLVKSN